MTQGLAQSRSAWTRSELNRQESNYVYHLTINVTAMRLSKVSCRLAIWPVEDGILENETNAYRIFESSEHYYRR
jgi:hypothetical protein